MIVRADNIILGEKEFGACSAISELIASDVSIEVTYDYEGSTRKLSNVDQSFLISISNLTGYLFDTRQLPKKLTRTYSANLLAIDIELQSFCEYRSTLLKDAKTLRSFAELISCDPNNEVKNLSIKARGLPEKMYIKLEECTDTIIEELKVVIEQSVIRNSSKIYFIAFGVLFGLTLVGLVVVSAFLVKRKKLNTCH